MHVNLGFVVVYVDRFFIYLFRSYFDSAQSKQKF